MAKKDITPAGPQTDVEDFTGGKSQFEQAADQDIAILAAYENNARAITQEQLAMNQLLGRVQATLSIATVLETLSLAQIADIKDRKAYRDLKDQAVIIDGVEVRLDTWDGFCKAIGSSRQNIELKLDHLQLLGESALARAQELGMTTRELRRLRKLDESDQKVIVGELEAAVGDKEAIIDLITEMSAKHAKDKDALAKQLEDQQAEAKASSRILQDKDKKIAELQKQIIRQENRTMDDVRQDAILAVTRAQVDCLSPLAGLDDAIAALCGYDDATLTLTAANILHELKAAIDDLQIKYGLGHVAPVDDSWMEGQDFSQPLPGSELQ